MEKEAYRLVETALLPEPQEYTGAELRSHFVRERSHIKSDGIIAFLGGCVVDSERLVDIEDAREGNEIVSKRMLHFIGEHFQCELREANFRLRLFISIAADTLEEMAPAVRVMRNGDDLFVGDRKLSVAICTATPTSAVFHFGMNDDPLGAPVPAVGLAELGVDAKSFAITLLERYVAECESIELAVRKVRAVP
jgi:hypothetical protein